MFSTKSNNNSPSTVELIAQNGFFQVGEQRQILTQIEKDTFGILSFHGFTEEHVRKCLQFQFEDNHYNNLIYLICRRINPLSVDIAIELMRGLNNKQVGELINFYNDTTKYMMLHYSDSDMIQAPVIADKFLQEEIPFTKHNYYYLCWLVQSTEEPLSIDAALQNIKQSDVAEIYRQIASTIENLSDTESEEDDETYVLAQPMAGA